MKTREGAQFKSARVKTLLYNSKKHLIITTYLTPVADELIIHPLLGHLIVDHRQEQIT